MNTNKLLSLAILASAVSFSAPVLADGFHYTRILSRAEIVKIDSQKETNGAAVCAYASLDIYPNEFYVWQFPVINGGHPSIGTIIWGTQDPIQEEKAIAACLPRLVENAQKTTNTAIKADIVKLRDEDKKIRADFAVDINSTNGRISNLSGNFNQHEDWLKALDKKITNLETENKNLKARLAVVEKLLKIK
jgi:hypothetical protein